MKYLSGEEVAAGIVSSTIERLHELESRPTLAVILVGDNKASHTYVRLKERMAEKLGIGFKKIMLSQSVSESDLLARIQSLNEDQGVTGMIVQLPLPSHINKDTIIQSIDRSKDVDGFHTENARRFLNDELSLVPVFPRAIMEMIESSGMDIAEKNAVIIGNSPNFGQLMSKFLAHYSVNSFFMTQHDIVRWRDKISSADIVIVACGRPSLLDKSMVSHNALVIDGEFSIVGEHAVGDSDLSGLRGTNITASTVPGGVGPVTIACLFDNVVTAAFIQQNEFVF